MCFQERSPKERFLTTPLCCTRVDGWKRRFMKTMTSRWWIPVNAHVLIKAGTGFNRYCVFFWTGKNHSRTQRVNADFFFENGENNFRFQTNTNTWGRGLVREWDSQKATHSYVSTMEPPCATTYHQLPPIQNTKTFPVKALRLEPLLNDHVL